MCENGGETFQAIFGARTPLIESFLIKRKLMGPCWVTVRNPKVEVEEIFPVVSNETFLVLSVRPVNASVVFSLVRPSRSADQRCPR